MSVARGCHLRRICYVGRSGPRVFAVVTVLASQGGAQDAIGADAIGINITITQAAVR